MTDHFQTLALPRRFSLALPELEKRYRDLSRETHPDKFATAPAAEKRAALERSTAVNAAYHALRDPVRRATHFLKLNGLSIEAEGPEGRSPVELSPEFLNDFLDRREAFEAQAGDPAKRAQMAEQIATERTERLATLTQALEALPEKPEPAQLRPLAEKLLELRYFDRFLQDLEDDDEGAA